MSTEVIVALVTSAFTFAGVIVTVIWGNKKNEQTTKAAMQEQTNLTLYRIKQLEEKQDKHNTLIERTYKLEKKVALQEEEIKSTNQRIDDLHHHN